MIVSFGSWRLWLRQEVAGTLIRLLEPVVFWAAFLWRRLLRRTVFIVVTGSLGKTTAKECLAAILARHARTFLSVGTQNARTLVSLNLLRVRPWHRFAVLELATSGPGQLARPAVQVRPDIAIVLGVGPTHMRNYASLDEIAREKMQILNGLPPGGLALLNGDDSRLRAIPVDSRLRVATFGTSESVDLRADSIACRWPERLSFCARTDHARVPVRTRMVGSHWVPSILAAMQAAGACGIDLSQSAEALAGVPPTPGRLDPVELPNGAVVIRDEYNASPLSYAAALAILEQGRAKRRIAVVGDFTDVKDKVRRRLRRLGRRVAEVCELAVFVGPNAHHARSGAIQAGLPESAVVCRTHPAEAALFLSQELRRGDLVLLKGWLSLHLERLVFAQVGSVRCWVANCPKRIQCDICWKLGLSDSERARLKPLVPAP